ncbi:CIC11C00000005115 [Sungouiella intermedia]|uniref:CIC11C00000005115 n=1 Tax=Sungouiella intermedia TaxID=45354 RepID=A0A1L0BRD4_9ASCO|nr:CIC11C00000005115 [[Candida] intermedia]
MKKVSWEDISQSGNSLLSPAWKLNGHVFTSGCLGTDASGNLPESVEQQTENAIKNLEAVLKFSGLGLNRVLKVLLFISNGDDAAVVNKVYAKYFLNKPARSCVILQFPNPNVKVELECVAEYIDYEAPKL